MHDSYIDFANSPVGSRITALLGLPAPLPLERYRADQPVVKGTVLLGAGSRLGPGVCIENGAVLPVQTDVGVGRRIRRPP